MTLPREPEPDEPTIDSDATDEGADAPDEPGEPDEAAWEMAAAMVEQASDLLESGHVERALRTAREAAARLAEVVGPEHPDVGNARVVAADALAGLGRIGEAEAGYRAALAIYDLYEGEDADVVRPLRVVALARLGHQLSLAGRYDEAEAGLRDALREAEQVYGAGALELADHANALGVCLRFAGRYEEAAEAYAQAEAYRDAAGVPQPPTHHHNLSGLATARGDYAAAERHARAAVAERRAEDPEGFHLATDLCGLGDALVGLERFTEAEGAYREALALFADTERPDHPEVAYALHNLGDALAAMGRHAEAERVYRDAIERKRTTLGEHHHEVAATLNNLAALLHETGRVDAARHASGEALAIVRRALAPEHPVRAGCESLARALGVTAA